MNIWMVAIHRVTAVAPPEGGKGEASPRPLWVDVQKLCNMCVLLLVDKFCYLGDMLSVDGDGSKAVKRSLLLLLLCVLSLSWNFFVSHDNYQTLQIPYALQ